MRLRECEPMILSVFRLRRGFLEGDGTITALAQCLLINDVAAVEILSDYVILFGIRVEHGRAVQLGNPGIRIIFIVINSLNSSVGCSVPVALKVGVLARCQDSSMQGSALLRPSLRRNDSG